LGDGILSFDYPHGQGWIIESADAVLFAEVEADAESGVIDIWAGPARHQVALFPIRVVSVNAGLTLVTFTFLEAPDLPDKSFAIRYQLLQIELEGLAARFDGAVHSLVSAFNACSYPAA
jgi:hypothetical protein